MKGLRAHPIHSQQTMIKNNVSGKGREQECQNPMETNCSRAPFGNLTNYTNGGGDSASNSQSADNNAKHRKRERDRARYAAMSREEKNAICLRQREVRQKKKGARCVTYLWCYKYLLLSKKHQVLFTTRVGLPLRGSASARLCLPSVPLPTPPSPSPAIAVSSFPSRTPPPPSPSAPRLSTVLPPHTRGTASSPHAHRPPHALSQFPPPHL